MINTIIFDLDGTLLPLDMEKFMKIYFNELGTHFADIINPKELVNNIWYSTEVMIKNTEDRSNEEVFMEAFQTRINGDLDTYKKRFDDFYDTKFLKVKESIFEFETIKKAVALLKEKGYDLVVATNPLFPLKAILHRIRWAGFEPEDFIYISSYERNHYCKPQIKFYEEILKDIKKSSEECVMVGNDVQEDMIAGKLGIKTYLIKDYILNKNNAPINVDFQGNYEDFYNFVTELPKVN